MQIRDLANFEELTVPKTLNIVGGKNSHKGTKHISNLKLFNITNIVAEIEDNLSFNVVTQPGTMHPGVGGIPPFRPSRP